MCAKVWSDTPIQIVSSIAVTAQGLESAIPDSCRYAIPTEPWGRRSEREEMDEQEHRHASRSRSGKVDTWPRRSARPSGLARGDGEQADDNEELVGGRGDHRRDDAEASEGGAAADSQGGAAAGSAVATDLNSPALTWSQLISTVQLLHGERVLSALICTDRTAPSNTSLRTIGMMKPTICCNTHPDSGVMLRSETAAQQAHHPGHDTHQSCQVRGRVRWLHPENVLKTAVREAAHGSSELKVIILNLLLLLPAACCLLLEETSAENSSLRFHEMCLVPWRGRAAVCHCGAGGAVGSSPRNTSASPARTCTGCSCTPRAR